MENSTDTLVASWVPENDFIETTNIAKLMAQLGYSSPYQQHYKEFHHWSTTHYADFWQTMTKTLSIHFDQKYTAIVDIFAGVESPTWFPGAKMNITQSCFNAAESALAIISQTEDGIRRECSYKDLDILSNRIANGIASILNRGDKIAIIMPMTIEAIAIFLGIIKAGCCVVSIPESFAPDEITTRLRIANAKAIFTQNEIIRDGKALPLYEKVIKSAAPLTIVLSTSKIETLRPYDLTWNKFLSPNNTFIPVSADPHKHTTILFSSGTTGEPKAIPWTHTTPIKCGSDAYLHHNIQPNDILCWPTSLGWMMGPWLIYASLLNQATIAIYEGTPTGKGFGKFIQDTKVTMLGTVPTLVKNWRATACMEEFNWNHIKLFSSTGECSNASDIHYLMSLANYKPIIEYCGGTEIGGAYITSTLLQPCIPSTFTTPALGLDFVILDEEGKISDNGEVALIPPSIGLSTELLNKNNYDVYYAKMPKLPDGRHLRCHGDQVEKLANGFYRLQGRSDDTMNLSGIKVSSAELEQVLQGIPGLLETAAIAVNPVDGGPSQLVIYAVSQLDEVINKESLKIDMQQRIKTHLNPLFKIHEVILIDALPRTASNKVMRRVLRTMKLDSSRSI
jgi:acetyl-CoA synthetase